jgi:branched-chain amino acid transport system ATP-binding protein
VTDSKTNVPVLELRNLSKNFGGLKATRDVSFRVNTGDRKAIIGPNGAGKTTLFNLITGIYPVSSGEVLLFGQNVTGWQSHQRTAKGMARTFQITSLFPKLPVIDNVLLAIEGLRPTKFVMWRFQSSYKDVYEKAHRLLEQAGFLDRKDTEVRNLSHGEQRQLEIVLGLASDPKVLLLDEPAAGCNPVETQELDRVIRTLVKDGITVVLVEHDMRLVMNISDRVHVLARGRTLAEGTPEQVRTNAEVIEAYLGVHGSQEAAHAFD